ncbi:MAG: hypothetical protein LBC34_03015 [Rickettsiales bacterium]|nr:hypothetical protein [Rickettsiales bacterium]
MSRRSSCSVVKCTFPGIMYQVGWLALFSKRAVDREYSFHLFTKKESAKDFDDIVLRCEDGKIIHRFIQTKHKKGRNKKISIGNLLTPGKGGAFGLINTSLLI